MYYTADEVASLCRLYCMVLESKPIKGTRPARLDLHESDRP
jgi:hypothetical protein